MKSPTTGGRAAARVDAGVAAGEGSKGASPAAAANSDAAEMLAAAGQPVSLKSRKRTPEEQAELQVDAAVDAEDACHDRQTYRRMYGKRYSGRQ
jgi:hypothetical protein